MHEYMAMTYCSGNLCAYSGWEDKINQYDLKEVVAKGTLCTSGERGGRGG